MTEVEGLCSRNLCAHSFKCLQRPVYVIYYFSSINTIIMFTIKLKNLLVPHVNNILCKLYYYTGDLFAQDLWIHDLFNSVLS